MRASFALAFVLPVLAAATPLELDARQVNSCNTGPVQCCDSLIDSTPNNLSSLGGLLGVVLPNLGAQIGLGCNPISAIIGIGGNSCSAQPACCTGNAANGLVNLGCTPLNANL